MSKVKNATDQVECHFCGQLWFIDSLQQVCIADGPDDFITVGMCDECGDAYEEHCENIGDDQRFNEDDFRLVDAGVPLETEKERGE